MISAPAGAATPVFQGEGPVYELTRASDGTVYAFVGTIDDPTRPILAIKPDGSQSRWGSRGSADGSINGSLIPIAVAGDELYAEDGRVQAFDRNTGEFLRGFDTAGLGGDTAGVHEVAVGPTGDVFISGPSGNSWGGHIARFSNAGALETQWGSDAGGDGPGQFRNVGDIATDPDGDLWVVDILNYRLQQFDRDGNFISQIQLHDPSAWMFEASIGGIFVDSVGHIWVVYEDHALTTTPVGTELREYDASGNLLRSWAREKWMNDVVVSPAGDAYIASESGIERVDLSRPQAELRPSKTEGYAGDQFGFDASGSWVPQGSGKYEWDLDGDGTFEQSTGSRPTVVTTYARPRMLDVSVKVTDGTHSSVATKHITVGPYGISINDGATFTNSPDVTLRSVFPPDVKEALISNDGGFGASTRVAAAPEIPWTLQKSGAERLPKTVYLRAVSPGDQLSPAFTDDIILDQTPPVIEAVDVQSASPGTNRQLLRGAAIKLKVTAEDKTSGVAELRIGRSRGKLGQFAKFHRFVKYRTSGRKAFVQVRDAAGNKSRIKRVRLR